ncbi:MAG TPA: PQQ-binding-like beta-propeller repeat protein [Gemmataceae bacterium]|nr:PQQ-binding-like beta-propeller repeat protein [Gemmataceae bacterium]
MKPILLSMLATFLAWFGTPSSQETDIWPQWRGPGRDGTVGGPVWPTTLKGDSLKLLWRVPLGPSYSGPIVAADRVFVTETKDKAVEIVRALDRASGKELWQAKWKGAVAVPSYAAGNGEWIRSTPAYDGQSLFVAGMRDVLICLDAANGKERWRVGFVARYKTPVPPFGFVCSPLVDGDSVYVQAAAAFVKLDKKTGKILWRVLPYKSTANGTAVSSPILSTLAGKRQVIVQQPRVLAGVDPQTGDILWTASVPAFRTGNIITPTLYKDCILTGAFGGRTQFVQISSRDGKLEANALWSINEQGYMSSPVIIAGHAYMFLRNQRFACVNLESGKVAWTTSKRFGRYWSMIAQKDRILALDQEGILRLIRANPQKWELLDSRKISEDESWAHVAIGGRQLFIRELHGLAVYRWERK